MRESRGEFGKDFLVAYTELESMDESEIYLRRINAKVFNANKQGDKFIIPIADGTAKMFGRDHEFRKSALRQEQLAKNEDLS